MNLNNMVKAVAGLEDTKDVNDWENGFIKSLVEKTDGGKNTTRLTDKMITRLEELYAKHYG